MKLMGIGDLFIPAEYIRKGFRPLEERGIQIDAVDWILDGTKELQEINLRVEKNGSGAYDPPADVYDAVKDAEIIITEFCTVPKKLIDASPRLRMIGVLRAGVENVDVEYATKKGIFVLNTPGRNSDAVADFTVGMMIAECRNIARAHLELKNGRWRRDFTNAGHVPDLPGKTVGIIGLGEIGRKVAKRLTGFDMNMLGYDPFVTTPPEGITLVPLPRLMTDSDFVTIHARHTKETEGLVSRSLLAMMKPTAYLINMSRSALVDEKALVEVLESGRIAGAALDVFDKEPPGIDYPLVGLDNVTISPHMAGGSNDAFFNSPVRLAAEMSKFLSGEDTRFLVNRAALDAVPERTW